MKTALLDYTLPENLIAQAPVTPRDHSRLMVINRKKQMISHHYFYNLPEFITKNDLLIINNTKVLPLRLYGQKRAGGAQIEFLLLHPEANDKEWKTLARRSRRLRKGTEVILTYPHNSQKPPAEKIIIKVKEKLTEGNFIVTFPYSAYEIIKQWGTMPLPPYIKRNIETDPLSLQDYQRYQTVYAQSEGAAAAPTAGLHFTEELIKKLKQKKIQIKAVTLHIGADTFRPIMTEEIENHPIHTEWFTIEAETAQAINNTKANYGRCFAVGTTVVRTLETAGQDKKIIKPQSGSTDLFITPGYKYKIIDALITNFHLPRTSLLALVAAFIGGDFWKKCYEEAIKEKYRFYSYGDAMLIL